MLRELAIVLGTPLVIWMLSSAHPVWRWRGAVLGIPVQLVWIVTCYEAGSWSMTSMAVFLLLRYCYAAARR